MQPCDEAQLLREAQRGDLDAFEAIQRELEPPIRRFVQRLMQRQDTLIDDLVQDVFISFYLNMQRIDPPENLRPYIFRMARNRCYDEMRRHGRTEQVSLDDEPMQMWVSFSNSHPADKPDEITHWLLLYAEVQDAMDNLPEAQRTALLLYAEEGFSYAEIATATDSSLGTVKSRIFHAKKALRGMLHPETLAALEWEFE